LVVFTALAYVVGVVVDGIADRLFGRLLARKRLRSNGDGPLDEETFALLRRRALSRDDGLSRFMEYQRSRQRIARDAALNLLILLPVGAWFLWYTGEAKALQVAVFTVATVGGIAAALSTEDRLRRRYEEHLSDAPVTELIVSSEPTRAAAVCMRLGHGDVSFLLVGTREAEGPVRWTFPKGHVEVGESFAEAAVREAREEAGVRGRADQDQLAPYLFPAGPDSKAVIVVPILVEVARSGPPSEPGRPMRWCTAPEAKALLEVNREPAFRGQHTAVIDEVLARISRWRHGTGLRI
jgi:8-oxo-dGTP pyrophosphatase MutT (NUDIX family)